MISKRIWSIAPWIASASVLSIILIACSSPVGQTSADASAPQAPSLTAPGDGAALNSNAVTLEWQSAQGASSYTVYVDPPNDVEGTVYSGGNTQFALSGLDEGSYTWWVEAINGQGGAQSTAATFNIDTQAPSLNITGGPSGLTNDDTPTFSFSVGGATTVQCRIDSNSFQNCLSGSFTPAALSDGSHTFYVRARDAVGNEETKSRSFSVDTTPPGTPIIFSSPNSVVYVGNSVEYSFGYLTFPGAPAPSVTFECRFYRTDIASSPTWSSCSSPATFGIIYTASYRFEVRAVDNAGNKSAAATHEFSTNVIN